MKLSFAKLCPGGNPTILITGPARPEERPAISARLMSPMHLCAEQVGFLQTGSRPPRLDMMGGEFCVNATRSAAFLLAAGKGLTWNGRFFEGEVSVSGCPVPVRIVAAPNEEDLVPMMTGAPCSGPEKTPEPAVGSALYCAAMMLYEPPVDGQNFIRVDTGALLVHLPGISHLLLDASRHPMPADWEKEAAQWRNRAHMADLPAAGVVWYEAHGQGYSIQPAVYVAATRSIHLETACGSASLALALADRHGFNTGLPRPAGLGVNQPSGETLTVFIPAEGSCLQAWVSGVVRLVASGDAWL